MAVYVKVVIIGAGMAGVAAAARLQQGGVPNFLVLEAMDRVGGRAHTVWLDDSNPSVLSEKVELGANWIHRVLGNPLYDLAMEHCSCTGQTAGNLGNMTFNTPAYYNGATAVTTQGEILNKQLVSEVYLKYDSVMESANELFKQTSTTSEQPDIGLRTYIENEMQDYLAQFPADERQRRQCLLHHRLLIENCESGCHDVEEVSSREIGSYRVYGGPDAVLSAGFQTLVQAMLETVPASRVFLEHVVTKVVLSRELTVESLDDKAPTPPKSHSAGYINSLTACRNGMTPPCTVTCENGTVVHADYIVYTGSNNVLKESARTLFQPELPASKLNTIDKLAMGVVDKIFLQFPTLEFLGGQRDFHVLHDFPEATAPAASTPVEQRWVKKICWFYVEPIPSGHTLLFWITGEEAVYMESLTDADVQDALMQLLRDCFRRHIPEPTRIIRTKWHSNPYIRGSYSFVPVHSTAEDIKRMAAPVIDARTRQPVLCFAGEGTHPEFYSTTHGAVLTGWREAERILKAEGLLS